MKKESVVLELQKIQKRIMNIPIDLSDSKQVEILKFAAESVVTVISFLDDVQEVPRG